MATGKVTKRSVDALQADAATTFLWDDELKGFGVRLTGSGSKTYIYQYRLGGRGSVKRRATIGRHGSPWTPATAREQAAQLALLVGQGIDPLEMERERQRRAVDLAFSAYVGLFVERYLKSAWKDWRGVERLLLARAVPVIGSKALPDITRSDIAAVLDRVADRPGLAKLLHSTLRKMFSWAVSRGDIERSPVANVSAPAIPPARDHVLSDADIAAVWHASESLGYPFKYVFRLLALTGQRREEVGSLVWSEVDRQMAEWVLPARRSKNSRPHIVPLTARSIELLDDLAGGTEWPKSGFLFTTTGETPVSGYSKAKVRIDELIGKPRSLGGQGKSIDSWRIHDLRRTVATGLQRCGVRFEVTEAVLNHISGSKSGVAGIYQRHDWKEEKRAGLEAWSERLASIIAASESEQRQRKA